MAHTGSGNQGKPPHVCHHCGSTSTPCWRKGPADKPVLCNACGARYLVKNSLDGYFPGSKSKVSVVQQGAVVKKPRAPKVPGTVKSKAFDNSRRLTGAASGAQVAMAFAPQDIVEPARAQSWYPATNWPSMVVAIDEPLHASSGSSESDSMDLHLAYRGKDDASSVDSQEAVGDYSLAATVAELLQTRDLPAIKTAAAAVSRFHRGRPRKQAHPRACAL